VDCQNEGIADLAENAGGRAIVNVHICAAQVAERFAGSPTARFKDTPGMGWLAQPLPCDGQAQFEWHVEARRRGPLPIQLDTGQIVEGIAATADQIENSIKPALAARNLECRSWLQSKST
jgi:hypothetical protein